MTLEELRAQERLLTDRIIERLYEIGPVPGIHLDKNLNKLYADRTLNKLYADRTEIRKKLGEYRNVQGQNPW